MFNENIAKTIMAPSRTSEIQSSVNTMTAVVRHRTRTIIALSRDDLAVPTLAELDHTVGRPDENAHSRECKSGNHDLRPVVEALAVVSHSLRRCVHSDRRASVREMGVRGLAGYTSLSGLDVLCLSLAHRLVDCPTGEELGCKSNIDDDGGELERDTGKHNPATLLGLRIVIASRGSSATSNTLDNQSNQVLYATVSSAIGVLMDDLYSQSSRKSSYTTWEQYGCTAGQDDE
jgi:hypothetical protein